MKNPFLPGGAVAALTLVTALGLCAPAARAQDLYVSSDRTVANGLPINGTYDTVRVGRDNASVNYDNVHADVTGGTYNGNFFSYNTSVVSVTGGHFKQGLLPQNASVMNFGGTAQVDGSLAAFDTALLNVTGGTVNTLQNTNQATVNFGGTAQANELNARDTSLTNITGGTFNNVANANSASTVNISGGVFNGNGVNANDTSTVNITGGTFNVLVNANNASTMNIAGGTLASGLSANGTSTVNVTGGTITNGVNVQESGALNFGGTAQADFVFGNVDGTIHPNTINITGGTITQALLSPTAGATNISGGTLADILGIGSDINITGGHLAGTLADVGPFFGAPFSAITLFGTGLTLSDAAAGTYNDPFGDSVGGVFWDLNGTLQNGDILNTRYFEYGGSLSAPANIRGATVQPAAVPEPSSLAVLTGGLVMLGGVFVRRRV